jgi:hypothetical protein
MKSLICAFLILATGVAGAVSGEIPAPRDSVILTVTGKIEHHNGGGSARFDAGMLQALPARVTAAATPWYPRKTIFEGPLGSALLDMVGAKGTTLRVTALNDYAVDIPAEDFRKWPVILAMKVDGKAIPVREKGPIFVIYPFDEQPGLYNEVYFGRSAWQVKSIDIR